jgi:hypothetical protein
MVMSIWNEMITAVWLNTLDTYILPPPQLNQPLMLEVNSQCNLQNSGSKLQYLIFFLQTVIKQ